MIELVTQMDIQNSAENVWKILTDFAAYPQWNPFMVSVDGPARLHAQVDVRIKLDTPQELVLRSQIIKFEPAMELRWRWFVLFPAFYRGEHSLRLEPLGGDQVRFVQREFFNGLALPFRASQIEMIRLGFEKMDRALKARAEMRIRMVA